MSVVRAALAVLLVLATACGGEAEPSTGDEAAVAGGDEATPAPSESAMPVRERPPVPVQGMSYVNKAEDLTGKAKVAIEIEANEGDKDSKGLGSSGQTGVAFSPNLVKVDPGATIDVTVTNTGKADHDFTVLSQKVKLKLVPGQSKEVRLKMPADTGVRYYCSLHAPMVGAFYSRDGQTVDS